MDQNIKNFNRLVRTGNIIQSLKINLKKERMMKRIFAFFFTSNLKGIPQSGGRGLSRNVDKYGRKTSEEVRRF